MFLKKISFFLSSFILVWLASPLYAVEVLTTFDPSIDGLPEAITTDYRGDLYVSMGSSVRKISPEGKLLGVFDIPVVGGLGTGDLAVKWNGDIFVNVSGDDASEKGVWRIQQDGSISKFADIDPSVSGFLNGLAMDYRDNIYVSDSQFGKIYKIDPKGNVSDWLEDPALAGDGSVLPFPVGANNIVLDRSQRFLYVSNLDKGTILRVRIKNDGSAGRVKVIAEDPLLKGIDGITFDRRGRLYAAINAPNRIVKISRRGLVTVVEEGGILDFPSDVVFGKGRESFTLYVTNFSLFTGSFPAILEIDRRSLYQRGSKKKIDH